MSYKKITFEITDQIVWIGFGLNEEKSLTTFSTETLAELREVLSKVKSQESNYKGLVFFSHKEGCFLAGVDVEIIRSLNSVQAGQEGAEAGQQIFNIVEDFKFPTIALVDGFCLGGGLELALSCNYIAVSDDAKTKLGLPEVMLGVLPGFGGTYRLPRKIGLTAALDLILTGKQVDSRKALKIGIADFRMPKERLLEVAVKILKGELRAKPRNISLTESIMESTLVRKIVFQKAREKVLQQTKGFYPAPLKILDHLEKNIGKHRKDYLFSEANAFGDLSQTQQSKALQNVFFISDAVKKGPKNKAMNLPQRAAVIGAGTMGGGIAWLLADNGMRPFMKDVSVPALELGLKQASQYFRSALKKKKISEDEFDRKMRSIHPTLADIGMVNMELVIEAIVEDMGIKKKVLSDLEAKLNPNCLMTSNTSSLSITEMSQALTRPEKFAGLHFFNPVNKMPLVEIITHDHVSAETVATLYQWVLKCKKTPVIVKDGPGFLVNRVLATYLNEATFLFEEGLSIAEIDQAAIDFGMPMGPFRLMDEVGLDVGQKVGQILYKGLGERFKPSNLSMQLLAMGLLGKKNSKGFYLYDQENVVLNSALDQLKVSTEKKSREAQYIQMRLLLPMINEAVSCLSEGIVQNAASLDVALIYGIGFPPFRGGLFKFVDDLGVTKLKAFFDEFSTEVSKVRYHPHEKLREIMERGSLFYAH